jgi:hypothetical protein
MRLLMLVSLCKDSPPHPDAEAEVLDPCPCPCQSLAARIKQAPGRWFLPTLRRTNQPKPSLPPNFTTKNQPPTSLNFSCHKSSLEYTQHPCVNTINTINMIFSCMIQNAASCKNTIQLQMLEHVHIKGRSRGPYPRLILCMGSG